MTWAVGGFVLSHSLVTAIEAIGGLVSLTHVIGWAPVLVVLVRALPGAELRSGYGVWCRMLLGVISIALVFDVRDAVAYLYFVVTGHPALTG